jgi:hypothetical protein
MLASREPEVSPRPSLAAENSVTGSDQFGLGPERIRADLGFVYDAFGLSGASGLCKCLLVQTPGYLV